MAGLPWFALASDFPSHPKTVRLALRLKDPNAGMYVVRLLAFCAVHAQAGRIDGEEAGTMLEMACEWKGRAGALRDALLGCGFLEPEAGGYVVHGWLERNGAHARKRERDSKKPRGNRAGPAESQRGTPEGRERDAEPVPPKSPAGDVDVDVDHVRTSSGDPLAEWQRGLAEALAVTSMTPFRVKPARVLAMRGYVEAIGVESAVDVCAVAARDAGKVPDTGDYFEKILRRAAEEGVGLPEPAPPPMDLEPWGEERVPTDEELARAAAGVRS